MPNFMFGPGRLGRRMPFMGFFGLAACLWPLLLAGLIVLAISLFSRRPAAMPVAPMAAATAAPFVPAPAASPTSSPAACANCGQPLQAGWRHCPNCGTPVPG